MRRIHLISKMADKSWMLTPNQRNKNRGSRRTSTDFMAANHRTQAAELKKTVQLLDDAYRATQRKQRREMMELRNFMRQVKTVAHVEIPSERRGRSVTKPITKMGRQLARIKLKEAGEREKRNAAQAARKPSFANIGAVYASGMSMQTHSEDEEEEENLGGILEEDMAEIDNEDTILGVDELSLKAVKIVNRIDESDGDDTLMELTSEDSRTKPGTKSTPLTVSASADGAKGSNISVGRSKPGRQSESLSATFGQSVRRSSRNNKGSLGETHQLKHDNIKYHLPPIQQTPVNV